MSAQKMGTIANSLTASGDQLGRDKIAEGLKEVDVVSAIFGTPPMARDSVDDLMDGAALQQAAASFQPVRERHRAEAIQRRSAAVAAPQPVEPTEPAEAAPASAWESDDLYFEATDDNGETMLISYATGEPVTWE